MQYGYAAKSLLATSFDNSFWGFHTNPSNVKDNCKQIRGTFSCLCCKYSSCNERFRSFLLSNGRGRCTVCYSWLSEQFDLRFDLRQECFLLQVLSKKSPEGKGNFLQGIYGVWRLSSIANTRKHCRNGMKSRIVLPVCVFPFWLWWASWQGLPAAAGAFLTVFQVSWLTCSWKAELCVLKAPWHLCFPSAKESLVPSTPRWDWCEPAWCPN